MLAVVFSAMEWKLHSEYDDVGVGNVEACSWIYWFYLSRVEIGMWGIIHGWGFLCLE